MKKTSFILGLVLSCLTLSLHANEPANYDFEIDAKVVKNTTPLCLAVAKGDVEGVKKLIELGADLEETSNGMQPIHFAARYNQVEILQILVENGASLKVKCAKGYSVAKHAKLSGAEAVTAYLEQLS